MSKTAIIPYVNRELSWLQFNYRVLQEAKDPAVPLLERIKFLAIYSSNLEEFFKVRVGQLRNLIRVGKKAKRELDFDPKQTLREILRTINAQQVELSDIFENQIIPQLAKSHIKIKRRLDLNDEQRKYIEDYFHDNLIMHLQPILLVKHKIRPFLNNGALYLACSLKDKESNKSKPSYAIVRIPSDVSARFVVLPSKGKNHDLIMLDDIIRHQISWMFPGFEVLDTYSIKLTRDAELYIDDEFDGDLIEKIKNSLHKRNVGPASRFVYDRTIPSSFLSFLMDSFGLEKYDLLPEGRYHNIRDFFQFPDFGMKFLKNEPMPPLSYFPIEEATDIFQTIKERDHLINVPYHSYESTIRLFEDAAEDPNVTHIKIVQYRVAQKSRILEALMRAVKTGKQVSVFIEVKARFDEQMNLEWGERLEKAGVQVKYSFPGLKVHSKTALIRRLENGVPTLYSYLSTGNFHEGTVRVYSDFGLFTAREDITQEVAWVFYYLENFKAPPKKFEHLLVGQFNLRSQLNDMIDYEIKEAKAGRKAEIFLKMNSLQDEEMILKLYEASRAGVTINGVIRGICCLVPGLKDFSKNIDFISIVDKYLEHSRIYKFYYGGEDKIYMSSADWMTRNLSYRVEVAFPIYDPALKDEVNQYLQLQLSDNVKARIIDAYHKNEYKRDNEDVSIRSQIESYYMYKRLLEQSRHQLRVDGNGHELINKK